MAILLVRIEDEKSLAFNEFFDYNGVCYAFAGTGPQDSGKGIDMTDFYEADVNTESLSDIPVVFVSASEGNARILGWYRRAAIFREIHTLSLFLVGNIKAYASDCVWLPENAADLPLRWFAQTKTYEVIEEEDARFSRLSRWMDSYAGANQFRRYHTAQPHVIPKALQDVSSCRAACRQWAELVLDNRCQDIRDLKTLETYARKLCEKDSGDSDGYYYLALACYHLGFIKEGLKQIGKALKLEPEASDAIALKGLLLVSRGYTTEGAEQLHHAWELSHTEAYRIMEGQTYMIAGQGEKAYECFRQIEDTSLLEDAGIRLRDLEKKRGTFPFGYIKLREIFRKI